CLRSRRDQGPRRREHDARRDLCDQRALQPGRSGDMNRALMMRLIAKDWYLSRLPLTLIALAGAIATGLLYSGIKTAGLVGLISALISLVFLSILIPQLTVVNERKQGNLAFVMSLPISPAEFTMSKVLGNLSAFVLLWAAIAGAVLGTMAFVPEAGGVIPLGVIAAL